MLVNCVLIYVFMPILNGYDIVHNFSLETLYLCQFMIVIVVLYLISEEHVFVKFVFIKRFYE